MTEEGTAVKNSKESKSNKKNNLSPSRRIVLGKKQNNNIEHSYWFSSNHKIILAKPNQAIINTNHTKELAHFLNHKAVIEKLQDGQYYWVLYIKGERFGPVEKATPEELASWEPDQNPNENEIDGDKQQ